MTNTDPIRWMANGFQKGAKGQKRQGGSKSPLKPKWVVLSLWGNRAVTKHSERGQ